MAKYGDAGCSVKTQRLRSAETISRTANGCRLFREERTNFSTNGCGHARVDVKVEVIDK